MPAFNELLRTCVGELQAAVEAQHASELASLEVEVAHLEAELGRLSGGRGHCSPGDSSPLPALLYRPASATSGSNVVPTKVSHGYFPLPVPPGDGPPHFLSLVPADGSIEPASSKVLDRYCSPDHEMLSNALHQLNGSCNGDSSDGDNVQNTAPLQLQPPQPPKRELHDVPPLPGVLEPQMLVTPTASKVAFDPVRISGDNTPQSEHSLCLDSDEFGGGESERSVSPISFMPLGVGSVQLSASNALTQKHHVCRSAVTSRRASMASHHPGHRMGADAASRRQSVASCAPPVWRSSQISMTSCDTLDEESGFVASPIWTDDSSPKSRKRAARSTVVVDPMAQARLMKMRGNGRTGLNYDRGSADSINFLLQPMVMQPSSRKHLAWQFLSFFLIIYDIVMVPLKLFELPASHIVDAVSMLIRLFWTLDILHSFFTGNLDEQGRVEMQPIQVARRYASGYFCLDFFCVVLDWCTTAIPMRAPGQQVAVLFTARLARIPKIFRFVKAQDIQGLIGEHRFSEQIHLISDIVMSIIAMLMLGHIIACAWYSLGSHGHQGLPGWVEVHGVGGELRERYAWAFHWSLAIFSGESIFFSENLEERGFHCTVQFCFFIISSLFVSSITTSLTRLQLITGKQASRLSTLRRYLTDHRISASLAARVQRNAQHAEAQQRRNAPESSIELLQIISEPLRVELHFEVHAPVLMKHPFFDCYYGVNAAGVQKLCHIASGHMPMSRGDVLFSDLETPAWPRMFFVVSGALKYAQPGRGVEEAERGQWASEAVLWTQWMHCGTLKADEESTLLVLDAEKFQRIISPFPTAHCHRYATAFIKRLNASEKAKTVSDIGGRGHGGDEELIAAAFSDTSDDDSMAFRKMAKLSQRFDRGRTRSASLLHVS